MNPIASLFEQFIASSNSSSSSFSQASSSSSSSAGSAGAGASSSATATSPSGETSRSEESSFAPGATSASASASATASDQGATTSAAVSVPAGAQESSEAPTDDSQAHDLDEEPDIGGNADDAHETSQVNVVTTINLLLGNPEGSLLVGTPQRDIFWGGDGADIFQLSAVGVTELSQADIILDYRPAEGDALALGEGITLGDLVFDVIDFSGDGQADSTVLRSSVDNRILGIVLNTVDELGETLLSVNDFTDPVPDAIPDVVPDQYSPTSGPEPELGGSSASSSSSAFVDETGAGGSSSATATSPSGETSTSSDTAYLPGASSIRSSASASVDADAVDTQASVQGEASGAEVSLGESLSPAVDILIGTPDNATLVGSDRPTIFVGHSGADLFVLSTTGRSSVEITDVILGFSAEQGDQIQLPETLPLSHIILESIAIVSTGSIDSVVIRSAETGDFYAVILDTRITDIANSLEFASPSIYHPSASSHI